MVPEIPDGRGSRASAMTNTAAASPIPMAASRPFALSSLSNPLERHTNMTEACRAFQRKGSLTSA